MKSQIMINRYKSTVPITTTKFGSNGEMSKKGEMAAPYDNSSMVSMEKVNIIESVADHRGEFGDQEHLMRNYAIRSKSMQQTLLHYDRKDKAKVAQRSYHTKCPIH